MAVVFDNNEYLSDATSLASGAAWSGCGWIYPTSRNSNNGVIMFVSTNASTTYNVLTVLIDGSFHRLRFYDSAANATISSPLIDLNEWAWVAFSQPSGADGTLWLYTAADGLTSTTGATRPPTANTEVFAFSTQSGYGLLGRMAAMKVWKAALTEAEILQEAMCYRPQRTANIWGWYPFLKDSVDLSQQHTLSATGTLSYDDGPPISWGAPSLVVQQPTVIPPDYGTPRDHFGVKPWSSVWRPCRV